MGEDKAPGIDTTEPLRGPTDRPSFQTPTEVGRYTIDGQLGQGGMGTVLSAHDPALDRKVAIKLLRMRASGGTARERFIREARAMAKVNHRNVLVVHEIGTFNDQVFIAMERANGGTLAAWNKRPHPWREIIAMYVKAGRGLAAAHQAGLVHRDFKPDNVLIGDDGEPRVADFGLVGGDIISSTPPLDEQSSDSALTIQGAVMGTPLFMAPEQHEGAKVGPAADQFAFCVSLWIALYGRQPYAGRRYEEIADSVMNGRLRLPPAETKVPARIASLLGRGLSVEPDARWPSMTELLNALDHDPRLRRTAIVVGAVGLVAVGVLAALALRGRTTKVVTERVIERAQKCEPAESMITGVWDAPTRAKLAGKFGSSERAEAVATWTQMSTFLDATFRTWATRWDEVCASKEATRDPLLHAQRLACYERMFYSMRAQAQLLGLEDPMHYARSFQGNTDLPVLADCENVQILRAQPAQPPVEEQRAAAQYISDAYRLDYREVPDEALASVRAEMTKAATELERLHSPFAAVAWRTLGVAISWEETLDSDKISLSVEDTRHAYERAAKNAEQYRFDEELARAESALAQLELDFGGYAAALPHAERAEEALRRAGNPENATHSVTLTRVEMLERDSKLDEAIALLEASARTPRPIASFRVYDEAYLAEALIADGRPQDAAQRLTRVNKELERELGVDHFHVIFLAPYLAISLHLAGDFAGARAQNMKMADSAKRTDDYVTGEYQAMAELSARTGQTALLEQDLTDLAREAVAEAEDD